MKLNNKGYLVVELVVSFAISLTVTLFLLATAFDLKKKGDNLSLETTMLVNQAVITKEIEDDFTTKDLREIKVCTEPNQNDYCYDLYYSDVNNTVKKLAININNRTIEYGTEDRPFKKRLPESGEFGKIAVRHEKFTSNNDLVDNNSLLVIEIPIIETKTKKNYDIRVLFQYKEVSETDPIKIDASIEKIDYSLET